MIANTGKLAGKTIFITGASRGIGKAIALKAASDGANIVVAAKTADPHPKLPGTIYSAAEEIEAAGGKALPCVVDVRDEGQVRTAVENAVKKFGGIDILINNASAIQLTPTSATDMKRFDLMHQINTRGTFLVSKECLPYLQKSSHAHILNISPPLNMKPIWFGNHVAYTMAKYGMSMCVLGMAEEFKGMKIGVNALWPMTAIHTAAIEMLTGPDSDQYSRKVDIMSDAAYTILTKDPKTCTGNFFVDEKVVQEAGVIDLKQYACNPEMADQLMIDAFLDAPPERTLKVPEKSSTNENAGKSVASVFGKIEKFITPEVIAKTAATYQFDLNGDQAGTWFLDLKNAPGKSGQGKPDFVPDATLTMNSDNFFKMFSGELKPATAFMSGKLKIRGDMAKALKMEKLLGSMKGKL